MKLGVLTVPLQGWLLDDVLPYLSALGVQTVELGTGGYTNDAHMRISEHLDQPDKIAHVQEQLAKYNMQISGLSCHGNPVHPDAEIAARDHKTFEDTVLLAEQLGLDTVITFSGCPGDCANSQYPNWVTCAWPPDFATILEYQWNEVLIPYWKKAVAFANEHGVTKIALEMHPGFCVYNPATLLRLREAVGDTIGANFDPSHLIWQGMDPVAAIRELAGAIHHFHAKDTKVDEINVARNGVLDTQNMGNFLDRSWIFRTVGYGIGVQAWKDILSTLRKVGYEGSVSIEHEDGLMSVREGLEKAIACLKDTMMFEDPAQMWWA